MILKLIFYVIVFTILFSVIYRYRKWYNEALEEIEKLRVQLELKAIQGNQEAGYDTEKIQVVRTNNRSQEDKEEYYKREYDSKKNEQS